MQQIQGISMKRVVFVQAARFDTHDFCSPGLELGGLFRQVHNQLVVLLLPSGKFFLAIVTISRGRICAC